MEIQKIKLTPWHGGECPVDPNAQTIVMYGDCIDGGICSARYRNWNAVKAYVVIECEVTEPPHTTIVPPEVWAVLPDGYDSAATSSGGFVYAGDQIFIGDGAVCARGGSMDITFLKGVIPAKCDWKESLVMRPNHGQEVGE